MTTVSRGFTTEELSRYNGEDGFPAFVALQGLVYDVTRSLLWRNGKHQVTHFAGCDLTGALGAAPHGEDLLLRFPMVGAMVEDPMVGPLGKET